MFERPARAKRSSLFGLFACFEREKSFLNFASVDVVFTDNFKKLALTQTRKDTSLVSG
jgi:hypothetical protein